MRVLQVLLVSWSLKLATSLLKLAQSIFLSWYYSTRRRTNTYIECTNKRTVLSILSILFIEPWFGGKRPNSFSVSAFYSRQSDISDRAYQRSFMLCGGGYGGMYGGGYGGMYGGYPGYGGGYQQSMIEASLRPDKTFEVFGAHR